MNTSKNHVVAGMVCALASLPVIPSVVPVGDSGIILVRSTEAQTSTEWIDVAAGPQWSDGDNWSFIVPTSSVDATHTTTLTDIQVNIDPANCDDLKGKGADNDRFVQVNGAKLLHVFGNLFQNGGSANLKVLLQNGTDDANRTIVDVDGNATEITFAGATGIGQTAGFVKLDVAGNVTDSDINLGDDCILIIDGVVSSNPSAAVTLGTSGGTGATIATVDSVGGTPTTEVTDWNLRGESELTITNDYDSTVTSHFPEFTMTDSSEMTVGGTTTGAVWNMSDDSEFTGTGNIIAGTVVGAGVWNLINDARVIALDDIDGGVWTVRSDGGTSGLGLDVTDLLDPDELTVTAVGTVECDRLSLADVQWDMTIKSGGTVEVGDTSCASATDQCDAWHDGDHPQATPDVGGFSKLTYSGTGNTYIVHRELFIFGEVIRATSTSELNIVMGDGGSGSQTVLKPGTQTVRVEGVDDTTYINAFDLEGVSVTFVTSGSFETGGPDYIGDGTNDFNGAKVLFTDSPCVHRWNDVVIEDDGAGFVELIDLYQSTPISGNTFGALLLEDALYVMDLTVETGAVLRLDSSVENIFYTGTTTIDGDILLSDGTTPYTPVKLSRSLFGNFNGSGSGDETADTDRFIDAWCTCYRKTTLDADYDPLTDWDCDGDVDNDDLDQYEANYGTGSPPNISAFDGLSSCPTSTVCD